MALSFVSVVGLFLCFSFAVTAQPTTSLDKYEYQSQLSQAESIVKKMQDIEFEVDRQWRFIKNTPPQLRKKVAGTQRKEVTALLDKLSRLKQWEKRLKENVATHIGRFITAGGNPGELAKYVKLKAAMQEAKREADQQEQNINIVRKAMLQYQELAKKNPVYAKTAQILSEQVEQLQKKLTGKKDYEEKLKQFIYARYETNKATLEAAVPGWEAKEILEKLNKGGEIWVRPDRIIPREHSINLEGLKSTDETLLKLIKFYDNLIVAVPQRRRGIIGRWRDRRNQRRSHSPIQPPGQKK